MNTRKKIIRILSCCLIFCMIFQTMNVMAATKRVIRYNGKNYNYTKSTVGIRINDLEIPTPFGGLIINNVSMLPAYQVFKDSELDTGYQYNTSKKTLTIFNGEHEVVFPIGKKYAYVDGKKKTLEQGALFVKDVKLNQTCLMVPARFTVDALGYFYEWDNDLVVSYISSGEINQNEGAENIEINTGENENAGNTEKGENENTGENSNNEDQNTGDVMDPDIDDGEGDSDQKIDEEAPEDYSIRILKPQGIKNGAYEEEDNYWKKEFHLHLDQDYQEFYDSNMPEKMDSKAKSVSATYDDNGNTDIVITTKSMQAFRVTETKDAYYIEIGNPKEIYEKVVVIDAGHGGTDPGTSGNGVVEKKITLQVAKAAKKYLDTDETIKVYYTRLEDSVAGMTSGSKGVSNAQMSLPARYNFANSLKADLFISVHVNSYKTSSPHGTEVFYSKKNTSKNDWGITSAKLAKLIHQPLLDVIGSMDRGVKTANYAVLNHTKMPAILIETAFASNKQDAAKLKNPAIIDGIGEVIYQVIEEAFQ